MTVRFALRCRGREIPLGGRLVLLGRDTDCDVRIDADGVMPRHIVFRISKSGVLLETAQGTVRVNGVEVPHSTKLSHGAVIQLGDERIRFVDYHDGEDARHTTSRETVSVSLDSALDALAELDDAISDGEWDIARDRLSSLAMTMPKEVTKGTMLDALGRSAAALAGGCRNGNWIDWLLELCRLHNHVPSSNVVDAVADAAPRCGWRGSAALDLFVASVGQQDALEQVRVRRLATISRRSSKA